MTQVIKLNTIRQLLAVTSLDNSEGFTFGSDGVDGDDTLR